MLELNNRTLVSIAEVPPGHLLFCIDDGVQYLALRVNAANSPPEFVACPLCLDVPVQQQPITNANSMLGGLAQHLCLPIGRAVFVTNEASYRTTTPRTGQLNGRELFIASDGLLIAGCIAKQLNRMRCWNVADGTQCDAPQDAVLVQSWSVGVLGMDNAFVEFYRR